MSLLCVVEGDGDVSALPALVRRIAPAAQVVQPFCLHAKAVLNGNYSQLRKALNLARETEATSVLLLLDSDCEIEFCPRETGPKLQQILSELAPDLKACVVLAECEFETWFIEAIESLRGVRGIDSSAVRPNKPLIRASKEWLGRSMRRRYRETQDQPALAATMNIELARDRSRSFRKLYDAVTFLTT